MHRGIHRGGTEGGDKCVDNVDKLRKKMMAKGDDPGRGLVFAWGGGEADCGWKKEV